jgi:hypothetical protein
MNTTIPADPRLRKRAVLIALTMTLVGLVSLYFFQGFLREMEALATASPQLAFEQLHPVGMAALLVTLVSAVTLAGSLAYASLCVYRVGQWPPAGWRVLWETALRTGRQASKVALFFLVLAVAVMAYGVLILNLPELGPDEQMEIPMEEV